MRLIIAEKPSMGREIAQALGIRGSGREYIEGSDAIVTWCVGHLVELAPPQAYDPALKTWSWRTLPILPETYRLELRERSEGQFKVIQKLLKDPRVTEVVNACDSAREGELIFHYVMQKAGCRKPVLRLWTSSLTPKAIQAAYAGMKPGTHYHNLRDSAEARSRADWLVGMNGTRAQTLFARRRGIELKRAANVGRVLIPVLNLVYQRDESIRVFVPEPFWNVLATFEAPEGRYTGKWFTKDREGKEQDRLPKKEEAESLIARLRGKPARIASVTQKDERKAPEQLYDLTALQIACNKRLGISAERTLEIAQALYETHKALSYPRTSSRHLSKAEEATLPEVLRDLSGQSEYAPIIQQIQESGRLNKKLGKRYVDDAKVEDHYAIIPTGVEPRGISDLERKVYDLVVRRLLAVFFPDRIDAKTTIITEVERERFKTTGTVCKEPGWTAIDPTGAKNKDKEDDGQLPPVKQGSEPEVVELKAKEGRTTPPKPYSEADLLGAMETAGKLIDDEALKAAMKDAGLGTPATRAATIEKLLKEGFLERKRTTIRCTDLGRTHIESIEIDIIKSPELTGEWEAKLSRMARGEYAFDRFMEEIHAFTTELVESIRRRAGGGDAAAAQALDAPAAPPKEMGPCQKCGSILHLKSWEGRYYIRCSATKKKSCKVAYNTDEHGAPAGGICNQEGCEGPVNVTRSGSRICVNCDTWQDAAPDREVGACPKCGSPLALRRWKGRHYVKCTATENSECKVSYDSDAEGKPAGGTCRNADCGGPVKVTRGKSHICIKCDTWQPDAPRGKGARGGARKKAGGWERTPTERDCPRCRQQKLNRIRKTGAPDTDGFYGCPDRSCNYTESQQKRAG